MVNKLLIGICILFLIIFNAHAFEKTKIKNIFVYTDENLNKKEIINFISNFNLERINTIYFLNRIDNINNGEFVSFGYWNQIFIYNMHLGENRDWRNTFCHEYIHYTTWITFRYTSEESAIKYCNGDKN